MAFNYNAAKQAGFTDQQIGQYMQVKGVQAPQKKSVGGFASNVVKSGARSIGDLMGAVVNTLNPDMEKNTVANLGKLAVGTAQFLDPTQMLGTGFEDRARSVGNFYKDRYGGLDKIGNTLYNDPIGAGLDVATVATGVGGALRGAGTASKVAGLTRAGNAFTRAAGFADPFALTGKGISKLASTGRTKFASGLARASDDIVTRGIGNPAQQAKAAQKAGRSVSSFIDQYGLYDRSPETAGKVKSSILNQYDDLALRSGKQVSMGQIMRAFDAEIEKLSRGVNGVVSEADRAKVAELIKRRDMLLEASGATYHSPMKAPQKLTVQSDGVLQMQNQPIDPALTQEFVSSVPINVGTDTLTNFRRNVIDPDVPMSQFGLDAKGSGSAQGVKRSRDIVKGAIDSTDPRLDRLGKDYGMAKSLEKILTQSDARGQNRQMFNFTKLGGAGVGGIISGAPGVATGFALETMVNNPKFIAGASKTMRAGSQMLNNKAIDRSMAKMGRVVSPGYNFARAGRMANVTPVQKTPISTNIGTTPQKQSVPKQLSPSAPSYTPTPKLQPYAMPKQSKSAQAFGGNVRVKRGSFY